MVELFIKKQLSSASGRMQLEIQFNIEKGQLVTLYGKSGAGKTSILRILAGLLPADEGRIIVNGSTWLDTRRGIHLPVRKRKAGFVFQDYALFPNMTVEENLMFALQKGQNHSIVRDLIEIIELGDLRKRRPAKLSGGQQQRVALARALVQRPQLLMLDEPLSALDNEIRLKLQEHILQVHREFGLTTILISHDITEVLKMSDDIYFIEQGRITGSGKPGEILPLSGKFYLTGRVLVLVQENDSYRLTLGMGEEQIEIRLEPELAAALHPGDHIRLSASIFNAVVEKL